MASSRFNIESTARNRKPKQNFLLVWVDGNVHEATADTKNTLQKLRAIVPDVQMIDHPDKAIDLLSNTDAETSFVITSGAFGQELVPRIHSLENLDAIYIFCQNLKFHSEWSKEWKKVIDVKNKIDPICATLQQAVRQYNQDNIAMVLIDIDDPNNLNQLPPSFMYTTLLKDAITNMDHDHSKEMQTFYQNALGKYSSKNIRRSHLDEFQQTYRSNQAIPWYTKQTFIYTLMNDSLRYLKGDVIVDMGFFIHDLHHQLVQLHREQAERFGNKTFKVYRGQALTEHDLQQLQNKKGGLFGFNNFLSTSLKRERPMIFAQGGAAKPNCVGVLFTMLIDPRVNKIPFADIHHLSEFPEEVEVLLGMHAVFRIIQIQSMGSEHPRLYNIELQLTADDDPQLTRLTEHMGENIKAGWDWHRIGWILRDMNQLDKAEEVYSDLLKDSLSIRQRGVYNHQLGLINDNQGRYEIALGHYLKSLEFKRKVLPEDDPELATSYSNIGLVYDNMGDYPQALSYYEICLNIDKKTLPDAHPSLATSYNNIGSVYDHMGEYPTALSYYKKSLAIREETLPHTHPDLAVSYTNMGRAYNGLNNCSKALELHNLALTIFSKTLPSTHANFACLYRNFAFVYRNMKDYRGALEYFKKAETIWKKAVPETHPDLAKVKQWIEEIQAEI